MTGGAGFIGANLCRALSEDPEIERIVAFDDLSTGYRSNLAEEPRTTRTINKVELVEGSILDVELLSKVIAPADAVVHLAARPSVPRSLENPVASHDVNATGTIYVLEAARRSKQPQLIVASSSSVYGANPALPKSEDMATMPVSPYAASKLATEAYALSYSRSFGMPVLALRFFNVFGPLQTAGHAYAAVVPSFISAAIAGNPLNVHGDGKQTRDFTFVGSVVSVLSDALRRKVSHECAVNLAFGSRVSLLELIDELEHVLDRNLELRHTAPRPGDVRDSQADQTTLRTLFPDVTPVALSVGLRATVDWLNSEKSDNGC